jgi:hypothetical protein
MLQNAAQMDACTAQQFFQIYTLKMPEALHVEMQKSSERAADRAALRALAALP